MSRESLVVLLGVLIFFLPVIGVPAEWKDYILWGVGALIALIGLSLRHSAYRRRIDRGNGEFGTDAFVESQPSLLDNLGGEVEDRQV